MRLLGDKIQAKALAKKVKVPAARDSIDAEAEGVFGGRQDEDKPALKGAVATVQDAVKVAEWIGYPVAIKAAAGGGGRGIRFAHNEATLKNVFKQAQTEAEIAFKDGRVYLEKCIENFRHLEVQIMGDTHGKILHFGERECSMQRRRQKVIEETPACNFDPELREEICSSAVRLAQAVGYFNAGTVEFMYEEHTRKFYFLEVNTRIQVEHPVTEMVTGQDLVKWQLRVAAGEPLTLEQKDLAPKGHAIECRINAEDPEHGFRPSPGRIEAFIAPGGYGVRWDSHIYQGYVVPPTYDSLLGKLVVHQPTRDEAIATMRRALEEFVIYPTKTTVPLCRQLLSHEAFRKGRYNTAFLEREILEGQKK